MDNYKLLISYDGTNYCGWQNQPQAKTIQGEIESALKKIFQDKLIYLVGSGRTDSGVHALNQTANFNIKTNMTEFQIKNALNSNLNSSIFIISCNEVSINFHSRFSAIKREYLYNISKIYSPFNKKFEWFIKYDLDLDKLAACSKLIIGKHDFSRFCKTSSRKENNICDIFVSKWTMNHEKVFYNIVSDRFLHHMVRLLVGTMIEVAVGRISLSEFEKLVQNKSCSINPVKSPAKGLFLNKVFY